MKAFFLALVLSTSFASAASMKIEGTCNGKLGDESPVAFKYYSNFDGCKEKSSAAIVFRVGDLKTGTRSFTEDKDIYAFTNAKLYFKNSTGNTSGRLSVNGKNYVTVQCEVRDYEYLSEC